MIFMITATVIMVFFIVLLYDIVFRCLRGTKVQFYIRSSTIKMFTTMLFQCALLIFLISSTSAEGKFFFMLYDAYSSSEK